MYLDRRALQRIGRILENIENKAFIMDAQGNVIYPENDQRRLTLPEGILKNPFEALVYGGVTLIGIKVENAPKDDDILYLCLDGDNKDIRSCSRLCSELISTSLKICDSQTDTSYALRTILKGDVDISEIESLAVENNIPLEQERFVLCVYSRNTKSEVISKFLGSLLDQNKDIYTDISRSSIAVIKALPKDHGFDDIKNIATALHDALHNAGYDVITGVSDPRILISELPAALKEAREAINVGSIYRSGDKLFIYRSLLLERFLSTVPKSNVVPYGTMVFNAHTARLFNEEMLHTIEVFFENNLNLSETARKLYIHRNTLVYRLEKVQRLTGFDLREFDDAVTFKLMMLLSRNGTAIVNSII